MRRATADLVASPRPVVPQGVDTIACVSVNDPFVMDAWGKSVATQGKARSPAAKHDSRAPAGPSGMSGADLRSLAAQVLMLADGSALLAKALGVELDLTDKGLGIRSRRYAMLLEDGVVKALRLEEGGAFTISGADEMLAAL